MCSSGKLTNVSWNLNGQTRESILSRLLENPQEVLRMNPDVFNKVMMYEDYEVERICFPYVTNINLPLDDKDRTALHIAVSRGQKDTTTELLSFGASTCFRTRYIKETPLHTAACHGNRDIIDILLKQGANVNVIDGMKNTPLLTVCKSQQAGGSSYNCIKRILEHKPDVNVRNSFNMSPLMYAVMNRMNNDQMEYICYLLLQAGADPNLSNSHGNSSLHHLAWAEASEYEILSTAELLLKKGASVDSFNNTKETPLYLAFLTQRWYLVDFLIENGADLNFLIDNWPDQKLSRMQRSLISELVKPSDVDTRIDDTVREKYQSRKIHELMLIRHLALKMANGYVVCERARIFIDEEKPIKEFMESCLEEAEQLKAITLCGTSTLIDILHCDTTALSKLCKDENIISVLEDCVDSFTIYGPYLDTRLNDIYERQHEEESTEDVLSEICDSLSIPFMDQMMEHFSSTERKMLMKAHETKCFDGIDICDMLNVSNLEI